MDYNVTHSLNSSRFEITEDGYTAYAEYRIQGGCMDIRHTIVPSHLENKGMASALVKTAYDWCRAEGLTPKGSCSFASAWLKRHPEYLEDAGPAL